MIVIILEILGNCMITMQENKQRFQLFAFKKKKDYLRHSKVSDQFLLTHLNQSNVTGPLLDMACSAICPCPCF